MQLSKFLDEPETKLAFLFFTTQFLSLLVALIFKIFVFFVYLQNVSFLNTTTEPTTDLNLNDNNSEEIARAILIFCSLVVFSLIAAYLKRVEIFQIFEFLSLFIFFYLFVFVFTYPLTFNIFRAVILSFLITAIFIIFRYVFTSFKNVFAVVITAIMGARLGIALGLKAVFILYALATLYDIIVVYIIKGMQEIMKTPRLKDTIAIISSGGYSVGLGDFFFPTLFVSSFFVMFKAWIGFPLALFPILFSTIAFYLALKSVQKNKEGIPGLPAIFFGSCFGFVVSAIFIVLIKKLFW